MPDVSPTKWHRGHTTWFFETFLLEPTLTGYDAFDPDFRYLFNSYYEAVGPRHPSQSTRADLASERREVGRYRAHVDAAMEKLIGGCDSDRWPELAALVELGLHHEQQHQELLLMDIKHVLSCNPLEPAYVDAIPPVATPADPVRFVTHNGGLVEVGHPNERPDAPGFAFDNESPRHKVYLEPFRIADRLVTAGEWLEFIDDGGYRRPELWLSDGWYAVNEHGWNAPAYWRNDDRDGWTVFTLNGRRPIDPAEPVVHVSHYEADAFALVGRALPTEFEWEHAVASQTGPRSRSPTAPAPLASAPATNEPGLAPGVRRRVAMDGERVPAVPALRARGGRGRRVQRQVHERPDGAAGRRLHHAPRSRPPDLPQLLSAGEPLDVRGRAARDRRVAALHDKSRTRGPMPTALPRSRASTYTSPPTTSAPRCAPTPTAGSARTPKDIPPKWFYDARGSQLFDDITRLPEYYPTRCERAILVARASEIAAGHPRRHARRARLGHLGEDAHPARRAARRRHDHALRAVRRERADVARRGGRGAPRLPVGGRARRRRRLRAPSRHDSRRRAAPRRVPRRDDRQPLAAGPRRVPARDREGTRTRRPPAARPRSREGHRPPRSRVRRQPGRHRRVQQERARP